MSHEIAARRWPDGRRAVLVERTDYVVRIRIGCEYQILAIQSWRRLPPWVGVGIAA